MNGGQRQTKELPINFLSFFFFSVSFQECGNQTQKPEQDEAEASSNSGLLSARVSGSLNQGPGDLLLSVTGTGGKPTLEDQENTMEAKE